MIPLSLYIHIPWCIHKCSYCDFFSVGVGRDAIPSHAYAQRLCEELAQQVETLALRGRALTSIFFGGGTPSMCDAVDIARVMAAAHESFACAADLEVTCEANPETLDPARLSALRDAGVNRLSMGVQSFQPRHLEFMERVHSPQRAIDAVGWARAAGFASINFDLIFGLPTQTMDELHDDLRIARELGTDHVSAYQLTVEPRTPLATRVAAGDVTMPDDDTQHAMFVVVRERLTDAGLHAYEISNFARAGRECRHNLHYWRAGEYLGIGTGAVSRVGTRRWRRARHVAKYLAGEFAEDESETLTTEQLQLETLMLGLRLREGVDRADFLARFGVDILVAYPKIQRWITAGHAVADTHLHMTDAGCVILDALLASV